MPLQVLFLQEKEFNLFTGILNTMDINMLLINLIKKIQILENIEKYPSPPLLPVMECIASKADLTGKTSIKMLTFPKLWEEL